MTKPKTTKKPKFTKQVKHQSWRFHAVDAKGHTLNLEAPESIEGYQVDELVIDHWLHLDKMDDGLYWLRVGTKTINVSVDGNGQVIKMTVEEDV